MVIDARAFAQSAGVLSGRLLAASCTRLCEGLPEHQTGAFDWRISGRSDAARRWLDVTAQGVVRVICQRCLAPFDLQLRVSNTLGLLDNAAQIEAMDALEAEGQGSDAEYLVADAAFDVEAFIEDELILALPFAPRHEVCSGGQADRSEQKDDKPSPFAVLAQLKKH
ncbi:Large ribosomal RNA subunit accumulation protein YceD OS=Castellaniella defragrans OX=75697 GN=HNR28_003026 PE=3 SV=1 [Castellaniella defragrans]